MNSLKLIDRILTAPLRRTRRRRYANTGQYLLHLSHTLTSDIDIHLQFPEQYPNNRNSIIRANNSSWLFQFIFRLFTKNDGYSHNDSLINDDLHKEKDELDQFLNIEDKSPATKTSHGRPVKRETSQTNYQDLLTNPPKSAKKQDQQYPFAPPFNRRRTTSTDNNLLPNPLPSRNLLAVSGSGASQTTYSPSPSPPLESRSKKLSNKSTGVHLPKTLVLDLDETLIHSTSRAPQRSSNGFSLGLRSVLSGNGIAGGDGGAHMVEVVLGGRSVLYHVYKRPHLDFFLKKVASWYTLVIFTASMQEYADPVIDWIDAGRGILTKRLFRESCTQAPNGSYMKDLDIIDKDLSRVALVDNSPISYNINPANGIPISGWISDPNDEALLDLLPFLDSLRFTTDVRRVLGVRGFT
ncbi:NIF-domain-containing protein [Wallemia mellicola]|uniref:NIF-domain-containing protein n=1 Tax=Wallemia mellicola TaxID=1708541 RepID=A0A4T0TUH8_9BASI|nr:hypothetical protein E3Q24_02753 [Wallemia mellicola]TIB79268.1 hypothetical protein E3Q23_00321 [Wallemia mellicola]TIB81114.1 NIF-domain-containing protein [Wallemia mellicola]TIB90537.1 NIF-domain-containing protein [Wallemia mellicola]TIB95921.1 NIF-domain-containing protein [Wallemia mellicola]